MTESNLALIEPRLLMRGLRITLPEGVTIRFDFTGLADTDSAVQFCNFSQDGKPDEIRIEADCRVVANG